MIDNRTTPETLIAFALEQLPAMQVADGSFCLEVAEGQPHPIGRSPRYTLMCLLGLHRARAVGHDVPGDLDALTAAALGHPDPELAFGDFSLRLWLACRVEQDIAEAVAQLRSRWTADQPRRLDGMQLAWTVIATAHALSHGHADAAEIARLAQDELHARQATSGLVRQSAGGRRSRFPNFATQIYSLLALATLAGLDVDPRAAGAGRRLADKLVELQRPDTGWPWVFDVERGVVVEPYHLYAVHQDAMAPMAFLELSEALDEPRYREVALRSLTWMDGHNDLGVPMLNESTRIIYRSIRRRIPLNRILLYANAASARAGFAGLSGYRGPLELNRVDRPYHLGWVLEAWCGRS